MKKLVLLLLFFSHSSIALPLQNIKLPQGYTISAYANVAGAREMAVGRNGIVYVGTRKGNVYAIIPEANFSKALKVITLAKNLDEPNGVALYNGDLYVAEVGRIIKFSDIANNLNTPQFSVVTENLPKERQHGWRYIQFSPEGWLYIGIGAPCNVCISKDPRFATIMRMRPDGSNLEIYAKGVRNTVGFAWNPQNNEFWFTDNGRDWLGDNLPPDELNFASKKGEDFGFPYFYGKNVPDPKFGHLKSAKDMTPATIDLGPHVAALGMTFYQGNILIAEHGSWNRSQKIGYRITKVTLKNNTAISCTPFITGWLNGNSFWGRPVDIRIFKNNSLLISDDYAGMIYRVSHDK